MQKETAKTLVSKKLTEQNTVLVILEDGVIHQHRHD